MKLLTIRLGDRVFVKKQRGRAHKLDSELVGPLEVIAANLKRPGFIEVLSFDARTYEVRHEDVLRVEDPQEVQSARAASAPPRKRFRSTDPDEALSIDGDHRNVALDPTIGDEGEGNSSPILGGAQFQARPSWSPQRVIPEQSSPEQTRNLTPKPLEVPDPERTIIGTIAESTYPEPTSPEQDDATPWDPHFGATVPESGPEEATATSTSPRSVTEHEVTPSSISDLQRHDITPGAGLASPRVTRSQTRRFARRVGQYREVSPTDSDE